jgi:hypothetical protein
VEGIDWIEAHGAERRDIAGGKCDRGKNKRDASKGGQMVRRDAIEQSTHLVRDDERTGDTQPCARGGKTESSAQDHLEDSGSLSSARDG